MSAQRKQDLQKMLFPDLDRTIDLPKLWEVIGELPERHSRVLSMLYDSDGKRTTATYREIGQVFGVTPTRIMQNRDKAIRMLLRNSTRLNRYSSLAE